MSTSSGASAFPGSSASGASAAPIWVARGPASTGLLLILLDFMVPEGRMMSESSSVLSPKRVSRKSPRFRLLPAADILRRTENVARAEMSTDARYTYAYIDRNYISLYIFIIMKEKQTPSDKFDIYGNVVLGS